MLTKNVLMKRKYMLLLVTLLFTACAPQAVQTPVISIQPSEALIDEPVSIRLSGFEPNQEVTIKATTVGTAFPDLTDTGIVRESQATFKTDANGEVDLEKQTPLNGSYTGADGMGLFWSLTENPAKARAASSDPASTLLNAVQYHYKITAEVGGKDVAEATVIQNMGSASVVATDVSANGVLGQFYRPAGDGPFPAVIALVGSQGGLLRQSPKVLASHGYAVLSLAYFNYTSPVDNTSLPNSLFMIPVEYFGKAIEWLQSQPGVDPKRIGLIGFSIGGTVALQVATIYPQVKTVIAIGSPTIIEDRELSYQGQVLPRDIPIEKINCSILLISGEKDSQLDSVKFGGAAVARLKENNFSFPYRHMINPGAGHLISFPYAQRASEIEEGGGSPQANAQAAAAIWPVVLEYLAAMK
ncbi:MAG: acyl-CoA thioester hydrolase/BAAT C-terminal domain-containing protein [Bacteroidota bacterium]